MLKVLLIFITTISLNLNVFAESKQSDFANLNACSNECDKSYPIYKTDKDKEKLGFHDPFYIEAMYRKISNSECKVKCAEPYKKNDHEQACFKLCAMESTAMSNGHVVNSVKSITKEKLNECMYPCMQKLGGDNSKEELAICQGKLQLLEDKNPKAYNKLTRDFKKILEQNNSKAIPKSESVSK